MSSYRMTDVSVLKGGQKKAVTQKEVAKRAGVSQSAASAILSGGQSSIRVSDETRRRIQRAAAELNYQAGNLEYPNRRQRANTFGIVLVYGSSDFLSGSYYSELIKGIFDVAMRRNQFTSFFRQSTWAEVLEHIPTLCDGRFDGLLLIAPMFPEICSALLHRSMPFVIAGDQTDDPRISSVDVDNEAAAFELVTHLLKSGHRRIATLSGTPFSESRFQGYRKALAHWGVPYDPELARPAAWETDMLNVFRPIVQRYMHLPEDRRPTAIFGLNDQFALTAMLVLNEMGLGVPGNISVVGFDDCPDAADAGLTTVRQSPYLVGEKAAELLMAHIDGEIPTGRKEFLPTELVIRRTVGPPRF